MSALHLQVALIITFGLILANAYEAEQHPETVSFENRRNSDGSYFFKYTLSDGTIRYERATFGPDTRSPDNLVLRVYGYYTYALPDGKYKYVYYKADENGFRTYARDPNKRIGGGVVASLLG